MNAEIEHASPYGKAPGQKVPGRKKKIGVLAMREYEARVRAGQTPAEAYAGTAGQNEPNCDIDLPSRQPSVRPSDLLIALLALPPAVLLGARTYRKLRSQAA